ncbi:hypothetical protein DCAR_0414468 [Daucus carota subsp. sativus]|uniref:Protein LIKE COV 1-like n=1 Tax=Daucus carota subsp. sativus TaxID=79200 RepID=A0AAF0WSD3_DAUCS|nr:hypothetical protein DCAR_0414468 [Daucus carota subsp. sativus]
MGIKEKEKEKAEEEDVIDRDLERLIIPADHIPPPTTTNINGGSELSSASSQQEAFIKLIRSWATKKFITGCVILFPIAITFYATWCFVHFVDGFFSPVYSHLGINTIGLGFVTSIAFIFLVGVFMSSWLGTSLLALGEWFIKKLPLMSYIYAASKQISSAISPDQNSRVFKEVAIIRHPRMGEYAFGFITATELCCVYVPTNHLYLGDIFLVNSKEIIRPDISVREGIEIVISGGMSIPHMMSITDTLMIHRPRIRKYEIPQV